MKLTTLLLIPAFLGLQSCSKEDSKPELPSSGSGKMGYVFEGTTLVNIENGAANYYTDILDGYSAFHVYTKVDPSNVQLLHIHLQNIDKPGTYTIGQFNISKTIEGKESWVYQGYSGSITISKLDTVNHIFSGQFSAQLYLRKISQQESWETKPDVKDTITIANGWFDFPLNEWPN